MGHDERTVREMDAKRKRGGGGVDRCGTCDGPAPETPAWDFRLDRSGLDVRAGRHLELRISLALLLWLIAAVGGWGYFGWWQSPLA
ncbi:hypothetical protein ABTY20_27115 [Streptomyces sp. NPDC126497]|uniref:hypothetical protein n=1 Tax=Streptomyces sp. NPDC126497 TaxID=3155313 RepID=UPI003332E58E